jgi:hypothetical protein
MGRRCCVHVRLDRHSDSLQLEDSAYPGFRVAKLLLLITSHSAVVARGGGLEAAFPLLQQRQHVTI